MCGMKVDGTIQNEKANKQRQQGVNMNNMINAYVSTSFYRILYADKIFKF